MKFLLLLVLPLQLLAALAAAQRDRPSIRLAPAQLFVRKDASILQGVRMGFSYDPTLGYVAGCLERNAEFLFEPRDGIALELSPAGSKSREASIHGFRVPFFGQEFSRAFVHANGFVTFDPSGPQREYAASSATARPRIAAFLTSSDSELVMGPSSSVTASTKWDRLVITYSDMRLPGSELSSLSFQIVLSGDGDMSITFGRMDAPIKLTWLTSLSPGSQTRSRSVDLFRQDGCKHTALVLPQQQQPRPLPSQTPAASAEETTSAPKGGGGSATSKDHLDEEAALSNKETLQPHLRLPHEQVTDQEQKASTTDHITIAMYAFVAILLVLILCLAGFGWFCILRPCIRDMQQRQRQREPLTGGATAPVVPHTDSQPAPMPMALSVYPSAPPLPESVAQWHIQMANRDGTTPGPLELNDSECNVSSATLSPSPASDHKEGQANDNGAKEQGTGMEGSGGALEAGEENNLCVFCLENTATHCFVPCGHLCVCQEHAGVLCSRDGQPGTEGSGSQCPVCRQPITSSLRVYT